jgi:oligoendopeptidase F
MYPLSNGRPRVIKNILARNQKDMKWCTHLYTSVLEVCSLTRRTTSLPEELVGMQNLRPYQT